MQDFPERGEGAPTYYLTNFSRKLHENEDILAERSERVPGASIRSATHDKVLVEKFYFIGHQKPIHQLQNE